MFSVSILKIIVVSIVFSSKVNIITILRFSVVNIINENLCDSGSISRYRYIPPGKLPGRTFEIFENFILVCYFIIKVFCSFAPLDSSEYFEYKSTNNRFVVLSRNNFLQFQYVCILICNRQLLAIVFVYVLSSISSKILLLLI